MPRGSNAEKGKQGFQETRRGGVAPQPAAKVLSNAGDIASELNNDTSIDDAHARFFERQILTNEKLLSVAEMEREQLQTALDSINEETEQNQAEIDLAGNAREGDDYSFGQYRLQSAVRTKMEDVEREAKRIYIEHGIPEKEAGWYAKDMTDRVLGVGWRGRQNDAVLRNVHFKVKRGNEEMAAASESATTDPAYQAAAQAVNVVVDEWLQKRNEEVARQERVRNQAAPYQTKKADLLRLRSDTERKLERAETRIVRLRSRIAEGVPDGVTEHSLSSDFMDDPKKPTLVRNADGTTNVWVWVPDYRREERSHYEKVVSVGQAITMSNKKANTLITESGYETHAFDHVGGLNYRKSSRPEILVERPRGNAKPLAAEGNPDGGWYAFVDSS